MHCDDRSIFCLTSIFFCRTTLYRYLWSSGPRRIRGRQNTSYVQWRNNEVENDISRTNLFGQRISQQTRCILRVPVNFRLCRFIDISSSTSKYMKSNRIISRNDINTKLFLSFFIIGIFDWDIIQTLIKPNKCKIKNIKVLFRFTAVSIDSSVVKDQ